MTALVAEALGYQIADKSILKNINISLDKGRVLGVIGPNGAGKTSLLKILSGQMNGLGKVSWQQQNIEDYSAQELAKQIAVVNQLNDGVFALNLQQIVRMGLLPHKSLLSKQTDEDDRNIAKAIARVGLAGKINQTFQSMSGGEQQRGLIARALVQRANLIILDEPVNHLDVYYQHQILSLLTSLAHQYGITVVMSLHDLNLAAAYCDQLCLLNQGELISQGAPEQVLEAPRLTQVFKIPCTVTPHSPTSEQTLSALRVDFYPPNVTHSNPAGDIAL